MNSMECNARYNTVIAGKTGVGKSALINYLYGNNIVDSGAGKPVTVKGFHPIDLEINEMSVTIFDSWGLEADKYQDWINSLDEELEKRKPGSDVTNWFHSIFYCIQGGGHRVENCDIDIIRKFIESNYKLTVIITKAEMLTKDKFNEIKEVLIKEFSHDAFEIIPVNSIYEKKINGTVTEQFGKDEIQKAIISQFYDSIIDRVPEHCFEFAKNDMKIWKKGIKDYILRETGWFNENKVTETINIKAKEYQESLQEKINSEILNVINVYRNISRKMNYSPDKYKNNFNDYLNLAILPDPAGEEKWWEVTCGFVLIIPVAVFGAIWGREMNRNGIIKKLDKFEEGFIVQLEKIKPKIKENLLLFKKQQLTVPRAKWLSIVNKIIKFINP